MKWGLLLVYLCALPAAALSQQTSLFATPPQPEQPKPEPQPPSFVAQGAPQEYACTESDLTGVYVLFSMKETPPAELTKWFREYQNHYLFFLPNHAYGYIASKRGMNLYKDLLDTNKKETVGIEHTLDRKYTLDNKGVLQLFVDDRLEHSYRCMKQVIQLPGSLAGELHLYGYNNEGVEVL